jgi:hypothetical protein
MTVSNAARAWVSSLARRPGSDEIQRASISLQVPVADLLALLQSTRFDDAAHAPTNALSGTLTPGAAAHVAGSVSYGTSSSASTLASMYSANGLHDLAAHAGLAFNDVNWKQATNGVAQNLIELAAGSGKADALAKAITQERSARSETPELAAAVRAFSGQPPRVSASLPPPHDAALKQITTAFADFQLGTEKLRRSVALEMGDTAAAAVSWSSSVNGAVFDLYAFALKNDQLPTLLRALEATVPAVRPQLEQAMAPFVPTLAAPAATPAKLRAAAAKELGQLVPGADKLELLARRSGLSLNELDWSQPLNPLIESLVELALRADNGKSLGAAITATNPAAAALEAKLRGLQAPPASTSRDDAVLTKALSALSGYAVKPDELRLNAAITMGAEIENSINWEQSAAGAIRELYAAARASNQLPQLLDALAKTIPAAKTELDRARAA